VTWRLRVRLLARRPAECIGPSLSRTRFRFAWSKSAPHARSHLGHVGARTAHAVHAVTSEREEIERLGVPATWTMTAAAKDYRESLALERELQKKTVSTEEWAERQIQEHDTAITELEKADAA
jgi:hypothetical protein